MATFRDMQVVCGRIAWALLDSTDELRPRFDELLEAASAAVMEEQGIHSSAEAAALPVDTVLGPKAQGVLEEIKALLPE